MQRVIWKDASAKAGFYLNKYEASGSYAYPPHDHENHWEFVYVSAGAFSHRINGEKTTQAAGELVLIRDRDAHSLRGDRFSYVNLAFKPDWIDRLERFTGEAGLRARLDARTEPPRVSLRPDERARAERLIEEVFNAGDGPGASLRFSKLLLELVERFAVQPETDDAARGMPGWLRDLREWACREGGRADLRSFCAKSGYSREHVSRTAKRFLGMTLTEYLEGIRVEKARELLRSTNYTILRIAQESGWKSLRHFQRRFAAAERCSPSAYRAREASFAHPAINNAARRATRAIVGGT